MKQSNRPAAVRPALPAKKKKKWSREDTELTLLGFPTFIWYALFSYLPMAGIYLAFIDYKPARGIAGSAFVGLKFFRQFFESIDCRRIIVNTLMYNVVRIALLNVFVGMLFALLLYEIKSRMANRIFQTAMLLPSFLSWTVVSAALMMLLHPARGVLNELLQALGLSPVSWYKEPKYWPTII